MIETAALKLMKSSPAYRHLLGRDSHAYLIVCEDALSSRALCAAFIAQAIGESNESRIFENGYADIVRLPLDDGDKVKAEDVKVMTDTVYLTPIELGCKYYIVENAETMTEAAQNKLLKILEEPPTSVKIFLLCANAFKLLPTVLSRVRRVDIGALSPEQITEAIGKNDDGFDAQAYLAAALSNGFIGTALKNLADEGLSTAYETVYAALLNLKGSKYVLGSSKMLNNLVSVPIDRLIGLIELILGECLLYNEGAARYLKLKTKLKETERLSQEYDSRTVLGLSDAYLRARQRVTQSANRQDVIDELLFTIAEVKAICRKSLA